MKRNIKSFIVIDKKQTMRKVRGAAVLPIFKTLTKNGFISTYNNFSTKIFGGCIGNDLKIMRT